MLRTVAIVGATAVGIVGVGTAALATTGNNSSSTAGTASTSSSTASESTSGSHSTKHDKIAKILARRDVHGVIVTKNGKGGFTTHDGIRGTVTAVSPSAITVKAADGFTQTYTVTSSTKVRLRSGGKGTASTLSIVHTGDSVGVLGVGSPSKPSATYVIDVKS
jgi:hypothetical protein